MFTIYQALHVPTGKLYIGITSGPLSQRIHQHYVQSRVTWGPFQAYLQLTQELDWQWTIVGEAKHKSEAYKIEADLIRALPVDLRLNAFRKKGYQLKHSHSFVKGQPSYMAGRTHSEEARAKMRESKLYKPTKVDWTAAQKEHLMLAQKDRKEVLCIELDRVFPSISSAARELGTSPGAIRKVLSGKQHAALGFTFKLIEKKEE